MTSFFQSPVSWKVSQILSINRCIYSRFEKFRYDSIFNSCFVVQQLFSLLKNFNTSQYNTSAPCPHTPSLPGSFPRKLSLLSSLLSASLHVLSSHLYQHSYACCILLVPNRSALIVKTIAPSSLLLVPDDPSMPRGGIVFLRHCSFEALRVACDLVWLFSAAEDSNVGSADTVRIWQLIISSTFSLSIGSSPSDFSAAEMISRFSDTGNCAAIKCYV